MYWKYIEAKNKIVLPNTLPTKEGRDFMNLKSFFMGATIGMVVVIGGVCLYTNLKAEKKEEQEDVVSSKVEQVNCSIETEKQLYIKQEEILEIISAEKKYQQEYDTENYEVVIKNTSAKTLQKVTFTLGEGVYEIYDMLPNESYKIVAYNTEEDLNLKVLTVNYEIVNYFPDEIALNITNDGIKVTGTISNNGDREVYPGRVIYFLKDSDGNTIQKSIEYAGCFFEGLVISPKKSLDFEQDIPKGLYFNNSKKTIVEYSDLEFKSTNVRFF